MEHFIDIYNKKSKGPKYCEDLLDTGNIKVNLKVDGKPFQVLYNENTDEIEWHGRSGNETTIGPLIDDYTRLFSKAVNDAIKHLEQYKDIIKKYKFLTFEVIDEALLLTAIIDKDGNFINDAEDIRKVAYELNTDVMPTLWEGKFNNEQKSSIMQILQTGMVPEKNDFINWVKRMFGTYKNFPDKLISASDEFIEGIVFFFDIDGKIIEYKLVDPTYRQSMKDRDDKNTERREKFAEYYEYCYKVLVKWLLKYAKKLDDNHIVSMQKNFIELSKDPVYDELKSAISKIDIEDNPRYGVQSYRLIPDMQKILKDHSSKKLFELFIKTFYKEKKRAFIISPEFQKDINSIVQMMESKCSEYQSLRNYLKTNMYF